MYLQVPYTGLYILETKMPTLTGYRLSAFIRRSEPVSARLKLPEKLKGGRIEKYVNYWKGVATDYREAIREFGQSCKEKPIKTVFLGSIASALWYANRHNPNERSFNEMLIDVNHDLTLVPESHRNNHSTQHQIDILRAKNAGLLRYWNFLFFSIMWQDNYAPEFAHYKSKCKYLTVGYTDVLFRETDRILDIGFLDRWWYTEKAMEDYDISIDEWDEQGRPTNTKEQLKQMW